MEGIKASAVNVEWRSTGNGIRRVRFREELHRYLRILVASIKRRASIGPGTKEWTHKNLVMAGAWLNKKRTTCLTVWPSNFLGNLDRSFEVLKAMQIWVDRVNSLFPWPISSQVDIPRGAVEPHEVTFRQGGDHHEERITYGKKKPGLQNGNSMGFAKHGTSNSLPQKVMEHYEHCWGTLHWLAKGTNMKYVAKSRNVIIYSVLFFSPNIVTCHANHQRAWYLSGHVRLPGL